MIIHNPVIAHRGASAYAPENTLAAFTKAKTMGAQWVEFDVMLTKDEQAVIFHDDKINRTTNGKGAIAEIELASLQQLDAGSWFAKSYNDEKVPTFIDVLALCHKLNLNANIEIKPYPGQTEATTIAVMSAITQYWQGEHEPLISSFDIKALELARSVDPDRKLGLLLDKWRKDWLTIAEDLQVTSVNCNYRILNTKRIKQIKQAGYYCLAYTVNRKNTAQRLLDEGVDGVFSDYPDLLG